ncbi:MAG: hypothetical protein JKY01_14230 [Pseudomonadales bacterium]|nr:hypothetical protein [Pseudomonadales bacterium]
MLDIFARQLREQRKKTLFIALALLLCALYKSFELPDLGNQILVDYVRNDDLDIVLLRIFGGLFSFLTIIGFMSHINRELFPERYDGVKRSSVVDDSNKTSN